MFGLEAWLYIDTLSVSQHWAGIVLGNAIQNKQIMPNCPASVILGKGFHVAPFFLQSQNLVDFIIFVSSSVTLTSLLHGSQLTMGLNKDVFIIFWSITITFIRETIYHQKM